MTAPACTSCRFAEPGVAEDATGDPAEPVLWCRRYPPVVIVLDDMPGRLFPQVNGDDWCGEWGPQLDSGLPGGESTSWP